MLLPLYCYCHYIVIVTSVIAIILSIPKEQFIVNMVENYGEVSEKEEYSPFEFQLKGKYWIDIKEGIYIF